MSVGKKVMLGIAAFAAAGVVGSMLVLNEPGKISLSAISSGEHHGYSSHEVTRWSFSTLNNQNDPTFNQLLGINNHGQIAGYFGSGAAGHPNKGYVLKLSRFGSWYHNENFPHGLQTQVIGINDLGVTVGFWSTQNTASMTNNNFGFYSWGGHFHSVNFPTANNASPPVNQLLGVNDENVAVGFYTDAKGNNHGYTYSVTGTGSAPSGSRARKRDPFRHQQQWRHCRLLHRFRRRCQGLPAAHERQAHHAGLPGRSDDPGLRRQRLA